MRHLYGHTVLIQPADVDPADTFMDTRYRYNLLMQITHLHGHTVQTQPALVGPRNASRKVVGSNPTKVTWDLQPSPDRSYPELGVLWV